MPVTGIARSAVAGERIFDCLTLVTPAIASAAKADGYTVVGQYLNVMTAASRDACFGAGLSILPLTEAYASILSSGSGTLYGQMMVNKAVALGCPPRVHVMIDLENPRAGSDCSGHVNGMASSLAHDGFDALLYLGAPLPPALTAAEIYTMRPDRYGRGSLSVPEPACAWCWVQEAWNVERWGALVDLGVIRADALGRLPTLWAPG
jgi:hypothetical protein